MHVTMSVTCVLIKSRYVPLPTLIVGLFVVKHKLQTFYEKFCTRERLIFHFLRADTEILFETTVRISNSVRNSLSSYANPFVKDGRRK